MEKMKVREYVDGPPIHIQNRTMKPLAIALNGEGGGDGGDDLTNVQCKAIGNCYSESPCTMNIS
jgi:hypothetical protein